MARSPLTLAASVTSALPRVGVVGVGELTEGVGGRFDTAVADLDDGRRVVVRVPASAEAADELADQVRVLRALSAGIRGVLPFRAPEILGESGVGTSRAVVSDLLPGYRVEAGYVPAGPGVATSLGAALASVHALPVSVVRDAGLPSRTPAEIREEAERLLDRAEATGLLPFALLRRWSTALASDTLWRFEVAVTLGGVEPTAFLLEDSDAGPVVTGLLDWHGLSAGDPANDLRWLSSAPDAAADVFAGYVDAAHRAPDARIRDRARLYAELEFARWLVHGQSAGSESVVSDAVALLEALAAGVGEAPLVTSDAIDVDDAIAMLGRVPGTGADADTSMHTDTYDPTMLSMFTKDTNDTDSATPAEGETAPVELGSWTELTLDAPRTDDRSALTSPAFEGSQTEAPGGSGVDSVSRANADHDSDEDSEAAHDAVRDDAARNALRRWTTSE